jgi:diketogulonate reductase-like aldo/keto reductase
MRGLTKIYKLTAEQIFYLTLIEEGIVPLIGTTSKKHMEDDLTMLKCKIEAKDRQLIWELLK